MIVSNSSFLTCKVVRLLFHQLLIIPEKIISYAVSARIILNLVKDWTNIQGWDATERGVKCTLAVEVSVSIDLLRPLPPLWFWIKHQTYICFLIGVAYLMFFCILFKIELVFVFYGVLVVSILWNSLLLLSFLQLFHRGLNVPTVAIHKVFHNITRIFLLLLHLL